MASALGGRPPTVLQHNPRTGATYLQDPGRPVIRRRPVRPTPHVGEERINLEEHIRSSNRQSASYRPSVQETSFSPVYANPRAPLLGGQIATGGISSIVGKAAVAGTVSGLGIGGIIAGGATLPGTEYVGPGNKINIDAPRHEADAIAKEHDVNYDRVVEEAVFNNWSYDKFQKQIQSYDKTAIQKFAEDYKKNNRWQSLIGHLGLRFKQFVEGYIGTQYPRFPGNETYRSTTKRKVKLASFKRRSKTLRLGTI